MKSPCMILMFASVAQKVRTLAGFYSQLGRVFFSDWLLNIRNIRFDFTSLLKSKQKLVLWCQVWLYLLYELLKRLFHRRTGGV